MKVVHFLAAAAVVLVTAVTPRLSTAGDFIAYEGKDAVQEGAGGAKKTIDGIDFWTDGAPPRTFKLIGYIQDTRRKSGLFGMARMAGLEGSIAKTAKKNGGDAVILVDATTETIGTFGQSNQTGSANISAYGNTAHVQNSGRVQTSTAAVNDQHSRYAVVKYLPEEQSEILATPVLQQPNVVQNEPAQ